MDLSLRSIRKGVTAFSIFALIASMFVTINVANASFSDVPADAWYADNVQWGLDNGILDPTQAYFRGGDNATRAEFSKMVAAAAGIPEAACDTTLFPDVGESWRCGWITALADAGVVSGDTSGPTAGYFRPDDQVLRAEAAKMVVEAFALTAPAGTLGSDWFTDSVVGQWYDEYMGVARYNCVFQGVAGGNTVEPGRNIVRAEAIALADRALNPTGDPTACGMTVVEGALTVSLDGSSPDAASIPRNGANIPYAIFAFTASAEEAVSVEELTITRGGLGLPGDFKNIKIYVDGVQVGSEKTLSTSTNTALFSLASNPIMVPAGSTVLVEVRADMKDSAPLAAVGSQNALCLDMADDVLAMGDASNVEVAVGGAFAVCGALMTTTSAEVGVLTYTVSQPATGAINVGDTDVNFTKVKLELANEDAKATRITFRQAGSADAIVFANLALYSSGNLISDKPVWKDRFVTFDLSEENLLIQKGNSRTFDLMGDVVGGLNTTVQFDIYRDWHIEAIGQVYGYGVNVKEDAASDTPATRDIVGGNIAFATSANNPIAGDVKRGANDHAFLKFNISTAGDGITVRKLTFLVVGGAGALPADIEDLKVWGKNRLGEWVVLMGPDNVDALPKTIAFTDSFEVPATSTQEYMVTADIRNTALLGHQFNVSLASVNVAANTELEFSDGTSVDVAPAENQVTGGTLTGNIQTVAIPTLNVSLAATPGDKQYVKGAADKDLVAFDFAASTADDIKITSLTVNCATADCGTTFNNFKLYHVDGSTFHGLDTGGRNMTSTGDVVFNINRTILAGETSRLLVRGSVQNGALPGAYTFNILAGKVTAEDTTPSAATVNGLPTGMRTVTVATTGIIANQGISDADTNSRLLIAQTSDEKVLKVRFSASELENWWVRKLAIINAVQYNSVETVAGWSSPFGSNTVRDLNTAGTGYNVVAGTTISPYAGQESVAINDVLVAGDDLEFASGLAAVMVPTATISYYYNDVAPTNNTVTLQFCEHTMSPATAGNCYPLNGGAAVAENQWVTETIVLNAVVSPILDPVYGVSVVAVTGGASDANDALIVDNIRFGSPDTDVSKVYLNYTNDGVAKTAQATMSNGMAVFNLASGNYIQVPADGNTVVTVTLDTGIVGTGGSQTGNRPMLMFINDVNFEASGALSNTVCTGSLTPAACTSTIADVIGNQMRLAKSAPTVARDTTGSTLLGDGDMSLYEWTVAANAAGDIAIKQMTLKTAGNTALLSSYKLFVGGSDVTSLSSVNITDGTNDCATNLPAACAAAGEIYVQFDDGLNAAEQLIASGNVTTFELVAHVTGSAAGNSISTTLLYDTAGNVGNITLGAGGDVEVDLSTANFVWSDLSASAAHNSMLTSSSTDWLDGWLVNGLSNAGTKVLSRSS